MTSPEHSVAWVREKWKHAVRGEFAVAVAVAVAVGFGVSYEFALSVPLVQQFKECAQEQEFIGAERAFSEG